MSVLGSSANISTEESRLKAYTRALMGAGSSGCTGSTPSSVSISHSVPFTAICGILGTYLPGRVANAPKFESPWAGTRGDGWDASRGTVRNVGFFPGPTGNLGVSSGPWVSPTPTCLW